MVAFFLTTSFYSTINVRVSIFITLKHQLVSHIIKYIKCENACKKWIERWPPIKQKCNRKSNTLYNIFFSVNIHARLQNVLSEGVQL